MPTPNERLKHEREQRGWSQSYLATQLGVPDSGTISRWERGTVQPSPYYQSRLCALFGKTAEELGLIAQAGDDSSALGAQDGLEQALLEPGGQHIATEQLTHASPAPFSTTADGEHNPHAATTRPLQYGAAHSSPTTASTPPFQRQPATMWRSLLPVAGIVLLLAALLVGGLQVLSLVRRAASPPLNQGVGYLYFASSGQVSDTSSQGITDEVQLDLHSLGIPTAGQAYYVWLLPDRANPEQPVVSLGQLDLHAGSAHLFYSDPLHTNLLGTTGQLLITEQALATPPPSFPSVQTSSWRYVASIPQTPAPGQQYSLLDHLRHLLSDDPTLKALGLRGGLSIWFDRSVQDVLGAAVSAREHWHPGGTANTQAIREQVVRVLNYLDGTAFPRPGSPQVPALVAPLKSRVALLQFDPRQNPPGYVEHIPLHVRGVIESPGSNAMQRALADQLLAAMDRVKAWLQAAYQDAVQLVVMPDAQVQGQTALALLDDLRANAGNAFAGQTDPATGAVLGGAQWIFQRMPGLAALQVTPYQPS